MKRFAQASVVTLAALSLTSCNFINTGNVNPLPETESDIISTVSNTVDAPKIFLKDDVNNNDSENGNNNDLNLETDTETGTDAVPTEEDLLKAYVDYINKIAASSDYLDDLVFTVFDTNNDGIGELLYSESNVSASGVNICFYNNGSFQEIGPVGCYGSITLNPEEGTIISVNSNNDYLTYEFISLDEYDAPYTDDIFYIEPDSDKNYEWHYYDDITEISHDEFLEKFSKYQSKTYKTIEYYDMYWYTWCNEDYDPLEKRIELMMQSQDTLGHESHLIVPIDELNKLIGTWDIFSQEFDGEINYADENNLTGKIVIDDSFNVTIYSDDKKIEHKDLSVNFAYGMYDAYMNNHDWYVWLSGDNMNGDNIYISVDSDDCLEYNLINTEEDDYYISVWRSYTRK